MKARHIAVAPIDFIAATLSSGVGAGKISWVPSGGICY